MTYVFALNYEKCLMGTVMDIFFMQLGSLGAFTTIPKANYNDWWYLHHIKIFFYIICTAIKN